VKQENDESDIETKAFNHLDADNYAIGAERLIHLASAVPLLQSTLSLSILLRFHLLAVLLRAEIRPSYLRSFTLKRDHK
jgi:hypothetical protein